MWKFAFVALMFVAAGCGDSYSIRSGSSPVAPSGTSLPALPTPPPRGPGSGTLTIRNLSPSLGATLTVTDCPTYPCAEQWRSRVDVVIDRDMTYPVLVMRFYDGDRLCALSWDVRDVLRADSPETFTLSSISLSAGSPELRKNPCPLPLRTTRIELELWSDSSSWTNTLQVGLPAEYMFRNP
jgi:hypothetical protein